MNLIDKLKKETTQLRESYIEKTIQWAREEYVRLCEFARDYEKNYDVAKERKYYSLPACVVNSSGTVEQYIEYEVKRAKIHYQVSIEKLSKRIEKKNLNQNNLSFSTSYLDPNISTTITDGVKVVNAYTIIASGRIQRPHYRYLVK